jgi:hypothetical protein
MNDLEKNLSELDKPAMDVPIYRQNLRRELLRQADAYQVQRQPSGFALGLTGFTAGLLAVLLVLFVARPDLPLRLNRQITGSPSPEQLAGPIATSIQRGDNEDLRRSIAASETDRILAEAWLNERTGTRGKLVEDKDFLTARRFVTEDGREVIVYTHLPNGGGDSEPVY